MVNSLLLGLQKALEEEPIDWVGHLWKIFFFLLLFLFSRREKSVCEKEGEKGGHWF